MEWNFDQSRPIYQQIIAEVKKAVSRGELKPGDRILSQRELAQLAQVNPNTVQRAYREMEQMGLVSTQRGQGTFISATTEMIASLRAEMAAEALQSFIAEMKGLGISQTQTLQLITAHWSEEKGR